MYGGGEIDLIIVREIGVLNKFNVWEIENKVVGEEVIEWKLKKKCVYSLRIYGYRLKSFIKD